jgi:hypothetical protein
MDASFDAPSFWITIGGIELPTPSFKEFSDVLNGRNC